MKSFFQTFRNKSNANLSPSNLPKSTETSGKQSSQQVSTSSRRSTKEVAKSERKSQGQADELIETSLPGLLVEEIEALLSQIPQDALNSSSGSVTLSTSQVRDARNNMLGLLDGFTSVSKVSHEVSTGNVNEVKGKSNVESVSPLNKNEEASCVSPEPIERFRTHRIQSSSLLGRTKAFDIRLKLHRTTDSNALGGLNLADGSVVVYHTMEALRRIQDTPRGIESCAEARLAPVLIKVISYLHRIQLSHVLYPAPPAMGDPSELVESSDSEEEIDYISTTDDNLVEDDTSSVEQVDGSLIIHDDTNASQSTESNLLQQQRPKPAKRSKIFTILDEIVSLLGTLLVEKQIVLTLLLEPELGLERLLTLLVSPHALRTIPFHHASLTILKLLAKGNLEIEILNHALIRDHMKLLVEGLKTMPPKAIQAHSNLQDATSSENSRVQLLEPECPLIVSALIGINLYLRASVRSTVALLDQFAAAGGYVQIHRLLMSFPGSVEPLLHEVRQLICFGRGYLEGELESAVIGAPHPTHQGRNPAGYAVVVAVLCELCFPIVSKETRSRNHDQVLPTNTDCCSSNETEIQSQDCQSPEPNSTNDSNTIHNPAFMSAKRSPLQILHETYATAWSEMVAMVPNHESIKSPQVGAFSDNTLDMENMRLPLLHCVLTVYSSNPQNFGILDDRFGVMSMLVATISHPAVLHVEFLFMVIKLVELISMGMDYQPFKVLETICNVTIPQLVRGGLENHFNGNPQLETHKEGIQHQRRRLSHSNSEGLVLLDSNEMLLEAAESAEDLALSEIDETDPYCYVMQIIFTTLIKLVQSDYQYKLVLRNCGLLQDAIFPFFNLLKPESLNPSRNAPIFDMISIHSTMLCEMIQGDETNQLALRDAKVHLKLYALIKASAKYFERNSLKDGDNADADPESNQDSCVDGGLTWALNILKRLVADGSSGIHNDISALLETLQIPNHQMLQPLTYKDEVLNALVVMMKKNSSIKDLFRQLGGYESLLAVLLSLDNAFTPEKSDKTVALDNNVIPDQQVPESASENMRSSTIAKDEKNKLLQQHVKGTREEQTFELIGSVFEVLTLSTISDDDKNMEYIGQHIKYDLIANAIQLTGILQSETYAQHFVALMFRLAVANSEESITLSRRASLSALSQRGHSIVDSVSLLSGERITDPAPVQILTTALSQMCKQAKLQLLQSLGALVSHSSNPHAPFNCQRLTSETGVVHQLLDAFHEELLDTSSELHRHFSQVLVRLLRHHSPPSLLRKLVELAYTYCWGNEDSSEFHLYWKTVATSNVETKRDYRNEEEKYLDHEPDCGNRTRSLMYLISAATQIYPLNVSDHDTTSDQSDNDFQCSVSSFVQLMGPLPLQSHGEVRQPEQQPNNGDELKHGDDNNALDSHNAFSEQVPGSSPKYLNHLNNPSSSSPRMLLRTKYDKASAFGVGYIQVPGLGKRNWPTVAGYSFSLWFWISRQSSNGAPQTIADPMLLSIRSADGRQYLRVKVVPSKQDRRIGNIQVRSCGVVSNKNAPVILKSKDLQVAAPHSVEFDEFQIVPERWYHLVVTHKHEKNLGTLLDKGSGGRVVIQCNGISSLPRKIPYPTSSLNGGMRTSLTIGGDVFSTTENRKNSVDWYWRVGPFSMFDSPLTHEQALSLFLDGPDSQRLNIKTGKLHGDVRALGSAILERIVLRHGDDRNKNSSSGSKTLKLSQRFFSASNQKLQEAGDSQQLIEHTVQTTPKSTPIVNDSKEPSSTSTVDATTTMVMPANLSVEDHLKALGFACNDWREFLLDCDRATTVQSSIPCESVIFSFSATQTTAIQTREGAGGLQGSIPGNSINQPRTGGTSSTSGNEGQRIALQNCIGSLPGTQQHQQRLAILYGGATAVSAQHLTRSLFSLGGCQVLFPLLERTQHQDVAGMVLGVLRNSLIGVELPKTLLRDQDGVRALAWLLHQRCAPPLDRSALSLVDRMLDLAGIGCGEHVVITEPQMLYHIVMNHQVWGAGPHTSSMQWNILLRMLHWINNCVDESNVNRLLNIAVLRRLSMTEWALQLLVLMLSEAPPSTKLALQVVSAVVQLLDYLNRHILAKRDLYTIFKFVLVTLPCRKVPDTTTSRKQGTSDESGKQFRYVVSHIRHSKTSSAEHIGSSAHGNVGEDTESVSSEEDDDSELNDPQMLSLIRRMLLMMLVDMLNPRACDEATHGSAELYTLKVLGLYANIVSAQLFSCLLAPGVEMGYKTAQLTVRLLAETLQPNEEFATHFFGSGGMKLIGQVLERYGDRTEILVLVFRILFGSPVRHTLEPCPSPTRGRRDSNVSTTSDPNSIHAPVMPTCSPGTHLQFLLWHDVATSIATNMDSDVDDNEFEESDKVEALTSRLVDAISTKRFPTSVSFPSYANKVFGALNSLLQENTIATSTMIEVVLRKDAVLQQVRPQKVGTKEVRGFKFVLPDLGHRKLHINIAISQFMVYVANVSPDCAAFFSSHSSLSSIAETILVESEIMDHVAQLPKQIAEEMKSSHNEHSDLYTPTPNAQLLVEEFLHQVSLLDSAGDSVLGNVSQPSMSILMTLLRNGLTIRTSVSTAPTASQVLQTVLESYPVETSPDRVLWFQGAVFQAIMPLLSPAMDEHVWKPPTSARSKRGSLVALGSGAWSTLRSSPRSSTSTAVEASSKSPSGKESSQSRKSVQGLSVETGTSVLHGTQDRKDSGGTPTGMSGSNSTQRQSVSSTRSSNLGVVGGQRRLERAEVAAVINLLCGRASFGWIPGSEHTLLELGVQAFQCANIAGASSLAKQLLRSARGLVLYSIDVALRSKSTDSLVQFIAAIRRNFDILTETGDTTNRTTIKPQNFENECFLFVTCLIQASFGLICIQGGHREVEHASMGLWKDLMKSRPNLIRVLITPSPDHQEKQLAERIRDGFEILFNAFANTSAISPTKTSYDATQGHEIDDETRTTQQRKLSIVTANAWEDTWENEGDSESPSKKTATTNSDCENDSASQERAQVSTRAESAEEHLEKVAVKSFKDWFATCYKVVTQVITSHTLPVWKKTLQQGIFGSPFEYGIIPGSKFDNVVTVDDLSLPALDIPRNIQEHQLSREEAVITHRWDYTPSETSRALDAVVDEFIPSLHAKAAERFIRWQQMSLEQLVRGRRSWFELKSSLQQPGMLCLSFGETYESMAKFPQHWQLDTSEGPHRTRRRLKRILDYHVLSQVSEMAKTFDEGDLAGASLPHPNQGIPELDMEEVLTSFGSGAANSRNEMMSPTLESDEGSESPGSLLSPREDNLSSLTRDGVIPVYISGEDSETEHSSYDESRLNLDPSARFRTHSNTSDSTATSSTFSTTYQSDLDLRTHTDQDSFASTRLLTKPGSMNSLQLNQSGSMTSLQLDQSDTKVGWFDNDDQNDTQYSQNPRKTTASSEEDEGTHLEDVVGTIDSDFDSNSDGKMVEFAQQVEIKESEQSKPIHARQASDESHTEEIKDKNVGQQPNSPRGKRFMVDELVEKGLWKSNQRILAELDHVDRKPQHIVQCWTVDGLHRRIGLLLICSESLYIIDNYVKAKDGSICAVDSKSEDGTVQQAVVGLDDIGEGNSGSAPTKHNRQRLGYSQVLGLYQRRYMFSEVGIEFFAVNGTNFLVVFANQKERDHVFATVLAIDLPNCVLGKSTSNKNTLTAPGSGVLSGQENSISSLLGPFRKLKASMTRKWIAGEISNFGYLTYLNTLAGRSYNDLTQYPVFPWVLCNYEADTIDLTDPTCFRDLGKPMGIVNDERLEHFKERYSDLETACASTGVQPFHYGTHYSCSGYVLQYMIRLEPFSRMAVELQGGQFDRADRLFKSILGTWNSASGVDFNAQDVRELLPEFYYLPEFLVNSNSFNLGTTQKGESVGDVELPKWAHGSPLEFIRINRQALESNYVSEHLHEWVDLIFGYKQRGKAAIEAMNVFHPLTYEGEVDVESIKDPVMKAATVAQIHHFGQTPRKLFSKPHPKRQIPRIDPRESIDTIDSHAMYWHSHMAPPLVLPGNPLAPVPHEIVLSVEQLLEGTKAKNQDSDVIRLATKFKFLPGGVNLVPEESLPVQVFGRNNQFVGGTLEGISDIRLVKGKILATTSNSVLLPYSTSRYITWWPDSGTLLLHNLSVSTLQGEVTKTLCVAEGLHVGAQLTVVITTESGETITGGSDGSIMVWELVRNKREKTYSLQLRKLLSAHRISVTCLDFSAMHATMVSGSQDGKVLVWDSGNFTVIREVCPVSCEPIRMVSINQSNCNFVSIAGNVMEYWHLNGTRLALLDFSSPMYKGIGKVSCLRATSCPEYQHGIAFVCGHTNGRVSLWDIVYESDSLAHDSDVGISRQDSDERERVSSSKVAASKQAGDNEPDVTSSPPRLLANGRMLRVRLRDIQQQHSHQISALFVSTDGRHLVAGDMSCKVVCWTSAETRVGYANRRTELDKLADLITGQK